MSFEKWRDSDFEENGYYDRDEYAEKAWNHQQKKIEELEKENEWFNQILSGNSKELEKKLAKAREHIQWIANQTKEPFAHYDFIVDESKSVLKSLEEKDRE